MSARSEKVPQFVPLSFLWIGLGGWGMFPLVSEMLMPIYDGRWHYALVCLFVAVLWGMAATPLKAGVYCLAAGLIAVAPVFGGKPSWVSAVLLLLSFVGAYATGKMHAVGISCVLLGAVLLTALMVQSLFGGRLSELVFWADREIDMRYHRLFGQSPDSLFENGNMVRGNNYLSGTTMLDIVVDRLPSDTIYLKGFIGANYTGSRWSADSEADFAVDGIGFSSIYEEKTWLQIRFECMTFMLNQGFMGDWPMMLRGHSPKDSEARTLRLHTTASYHGSYEPYFSLYAGSAEYQYEFAEGEGIDTYFYYEYPQLDLERMRRNEIFFSQKLLDVRALYGEYAREKYLDVPEKRVPGLSEICLQNPLTELSDITDFIKSTVMDGSEYTRTPGLTPINRDVVEYFLFESRRGFCMHYASAATLMYRMYGVPARYVTGVVVAPGDFALQPDGTYAATLTDLRKHAWVEIYREDYGWIPVEVTPAEYMGGGAAPAGWNMNMSLEDMEGKGQAFHIIGMDTVQEDEEEEEEAETEAEEEEEDDAEEEEEEEGPAAEEGATVREGDAKAGAYGAYVAAILGLFVFLLYIRRRILVEERKGMEVRRLFYRMLKYAQWSGRLTGYSGQERDFAEKLSEEFECMDAGTAERLTDIVMRAAYSNAPISDEERREVFFAYQRMDVEIYRGLPPVRKIDARLIHVYHL